MSERRASPVKMLYFASLRERIGRAEETVTLPPSVATVGDLISWLKTQGPEYAAAFVDEALVRAAVNHAHARREASLKGAREIALFPPMTGG